MIKLNAGQQKTTPQNFVKPRLTCRLPAIHDLFFLSFFFTFVFNFFVVNKKETLKTLEKGVKYVQN